PKVEKELDIFSEYRVQYFHLSCREYSILFSKWVSYLCPVPETVKEKYPDEIPYIMLSPRSL
ncbi:MAG: hypothetical protein SFH39_13515, partial [Candidatus Magnetobacterium sp. LHC-1]